MNRLNMLGLIRHLPPFKVNYPCGIAACISDHGCAKYPTLHENVMPSMLYVYCESLRP